MNSKIVVIDDDESARQSLIWLLESIKMNVVAYESPLTYLDNIDEESDMCIILDIRMPKMSGLALQDELKKRDLHIPIIFVSGQATIETAVAAMNHGAINFFTKPYRDHEILDSINHAIHLREKQIKASHKKKMIKAIINRLTIKEQAILDKLAYGFSSKQISEVMEISQKTVEFYRSNIMKKTESKNFAGLLKLFFEFELSENRASLL